MNDDEPLFVIRTSDIQHEALISIGRELDFDELGFAKKALEAALLFGIDTVYSTIFFDITSNESSNN